MKLKGLGPDGRFLGKDKLAPDRNPSAKDRVLPDTRCWPMYQPRDWLTYRSWAAAQPQAELYPLQSGPYGLRSSPAECMKLVEQAEAHNAPPTPTML